MYFTLGEMIYLLLGPFLVFFAAGIIIGLTGVIRNK